MTPSSSPRQTHGCVAPSPSFPRDVADGQGTARTRGATHSPLHGSGGPLWPAPEGVGIYAEGERVCLSVIEPWEANGWSLRCHHPSSDLTIDLWFYDHFDLVPPKPDFSQGCHVLAELFERNEARKKS